VPAIGSAIAVPGLFRPVITRVDGSCVPLIDGGFLNPHPSWIAPIDRPVIVELFPIVDRVYHHKPGAIIVPVGDTWLPPFTHLTPKLCKEQFQRGQRIAKQVLQPQIDKGLLNRIPTTGN